MVTNNIIVPTCNSSLSTTCHWINKANSIIARTINIIINTIYPHCNKFLIWRIETSIVSESLTNLWVDQFPSEILSYILTIANDLAIHYYMGTKQYWILLCGHHQICQKAQNTK